MIQRKLYPPTYFNATILVMIILNYVSPILNIVSAYWKLIGIIPLVVGILLNLFADKSIKDSNTTVKPGEISKFLITNGVFQISRNPMYLGMVLIHISTGIFLGSLSPFFAIPIFIYLIEKNFIRKEESMLRDRFGNKWIEYKDVVRKWI